MKGPQRSKEGVDLPSPAAKLDGAPLYQRLFESLRDAIESLTYPVGSLLPTETKLAEMYGVGRHTIREALRRLTDLGYVMRKQGFGTQVISPTPKSSYTHAIKSLNDLFQYTSDTALKIDQLNSLVIGDSESADLHVPSGTRWMHICGTRQSASADAVAWYTHIYVHMRFSPHLRDATAMENGSIYALIESKSGERVAGALQEISAKTMPVSVSHKLGMPNGTAALRIVRRYLDESGGPMLVAINWHPADSFTYVMRLQRE